MTCSTSCPAVVCSSLSRCLSGASGKIKDDGDDGAFVVILRVPVQAGDFLRDVPTVTLDSPFITTVDHTKGTVDLAIELDKQAGSAISGELTVSFTPKNFDGTASYFIKTVSAARWCW